MNTFEKSIPVKSIFLTIAFFSVVCLNFLIPDDTVVASTNNIVGNNGTATV